MKFLLDFQTKNFLENNRAFNNEISPGTTRRQLHNEIRTVLSIFIGSTSASDEPIFLRSLAWPCAARSFSVRFIGKHLQVES